jgi:uncharacterized membrane protein YedE/YeeE
MLEWMKEPWPWYVSGPLIGLMVPMLYIFSNKSFGISSSLKHICAACLPGNIDFFKYEWKKEFWSVFFVAGILIGGAIASLFTNNEPIQITEGTREQLMLLGFSNFNEFIPREIFNWTNLFSIQGFVFIVFGGFMVGFGSRYAGGCTSGHAITGLSNFQKSSLIAVIGFFIGGLFVTHLIFPIIL